MTNYSVYNSNELPLCLAQRCMYSNGMPIPGCNQNMAGSTGGLQTDLYLYVTMDGTSCATPGMTAYSTPCLFDSYTNRPVIGMLNLCGHDALGFVQVEKFVAIVVHELIHMLVCGRGG